MERFFHRDIRKDIEAAKTFGKIVLSRAPIIPIALATPTAIVVSAAETGAAQASEEVCAISVESYNPNRESVLKRHLTTNLPCDASVSINFDFNNESGDLSYATPETTRNQRDHDRNVMIIILGSGILVVAAAWAEGIMHARKAA